MEPKELSWPERGHLWLRLGIRLALFILFLLALFLLVPPLLSLLMPFALALLVAWLLNPLVRVLHQKLGGSRNLISFFLILLLFCLVGGLLSGLIYTATNELISLANNWQSLWDAILAAIDSFSHQLDRVPSVVPSDITDYTRNLIEQFSQWLEKTIPSVISVTATRAGSFAIKLPSVVLGIIVFIMAAYFITADYPRIRFLVTRHFAGQRRARLSDIKHAATSAFGGYVRAQFILSVIVFFILLIGFFIMGQNYAFLLAFLLAIMDFIPIIGAGTFIVPWAVVALLGGDVRTCVSLIVIWAIIVVFRRVSEPKVVGDQTGLSPILSLISIYVGMRVAGVLGMILGPVLCLVAISIARSGLLNGTAADLRLAFNDISSLLSHSEAPKK